MITPDASRMNARLASNLPAPVPVGEAAPANANNKPQCVDIPVADALTELPDATPDGF
jgi:hypothetical protein